MIKLNNYLKKINYNSIILFIIAVFYTSSAFILNSRPFIFSLLSSIGFSVMPTFFGAFAGSFFAPNTIIHLIVIFLLFLLRTYISKGKYNEKIYVRIIEGCVSSALYSLLALIFESVSFKTVISAVITILFSLFFTYLFSIYFYNNNQDNRITDIGIPALLFCFIYSINIYDIYGFYPSVILSYLITLFISKKYGYMKGGIIGLICGIACGSNALVYSPLIAICGIICGILYNFSEVISISTMIFISIIYGIYATDLNTLNSIFQNIVFVMIIYIPYLYFNTKFSFIKDKVSDSIKVSNLAVPTFASGFSVKKRVDMLSKTYYELSELFVKLSKYQTRPTKEEMSNIIKLCLEDKCNDCENKKECICKVLELSKKYCLNSEQIPQIKFLHSSDCFKNLIININEKLKMLVNNKKLKDNCLETSEKMYDISLAISSVGDEESDLMPNPEIAEKISLALAKINISNTGVYAQGKRGVNVFAYGVKPVEFKIGVNDLAQMLSNECKICFSTPKLMFDNNTFTLNIKRKPKYKILSSYKQYEKVNGLINGDSICSFYTQADYFVMLCDGMGSGDEAACTSRVACQILEKLINSGMSLEKSVKYLNKLLIKKFDEVFTTLDILKLDIYSGDSVMYKSGASSTIVIRKDKKYEISMSSTPIGIIEDVQSESVKLKFTDGDIIIMFSDGLYDLYENSDEIYKQIKDITNKNTDEICNQLLSKAESDDLRNDDISVIVMKIVKK